MELIISFFPILHVIIIIAGIILLVFVKKKYPRVRNLELIAVFILFIILAGGGMVFEEKGSKAALFLELFLSEELYSAQ